MSYQIDNSETDEVIPLPEISAATLTQVFNYCNLSGFQDGPYVEKPVLQDSVDGVFPDWEAEFFKQMSY